MKKNYLLNFAVTLLISFILCGIWLVKNYSFQETKYETFIPWNDIFLLLGFVAFSLAIFIYLSIRTSKSSLLSQAIIANESSNMETNLRNTPVKNLENNNGDSLMSALQLERKKLYNMLDNLPILFHVQASDYTLPFANKLFKERFGEIENRKCFEVMHKRNSACEKCIPFKILETQRSETSIWNAFDGNTYFTVMTPFSDVDDSPLILEMAIDITKQFQAQGELKKANMQLIHAEKLSAAGKLAASIAHEFNNPIYGVRNVLEELYEEIDLTDSQDRMMSLAIKECNRMAGLVEKLLDLNRPSPGILSRVNVHRILNEVVELVEKKLKERNIIIEKLYIEKLPEIMAVEDQLKQIFLNIIQNAEESITDKSGKISISSDKFDDFIVIHCQDTGGGIKPEIKESIFNPFFTTKAPRKGTGLGLSVTYGIVKSWGGEISVQSKVGTGTAFSLRLLINGPINIENVDLFNNS
jgi:C4-dicarboxylate-specific signal transduction histidine kinase